jgi:hypothetical protein
VCTYAGQKLSILALSREKMFHFSSLHRLPSGLEESAPLQRQQWIVLKIQSKLIQGLVQPMEWILIFYTVEMTREQREKSKFYWGRLYARVDTNKINNNLMMIIDAHCLPSPSKQIGI